MCESARAFVFVRCVDTEHAVAQIPWDEQFDHETGRVLFGSNLLALTWIKGEAMPGDLVEEVLRGLGLEREKDERRQQRVARRPSALV